MADRICIINSCTKLERARGWCVNHYALWQRHGDPTKTTRPTDYRPEVLDTIRTRFYWTWVAIKDRCNNPNNPGYARYGGRGIKVCAAWQHSYQSFYDNMFSTYKQGLTIERINNHGDYEPTNCRWATRLEQARNTRNTENAKRFTYKGQTKTVREWAELAGLKRSTLDMRLNKYGWTIKKALGGIF